MNKVRVEVHQFRVLAIWVDHSNEIERFIILAASYSAGRFKVEHSLEAIEVLWLDGVEAQSDWYGHEATVAFQHFLVDFVQEDVAIITDNNTEV